MSYRTEPPIDTELEITSMAHSLPQAINFKAELIQTAGSKMKQTRRFAGVLFMSGAVALAATLAKAQDISQTTNPGAHHS
jgi:hypothetical protein